MVRLRQGGVDPGRQVVIAGILLQGMPPGAEGFAAPAQFQESISDML
jgi:hypothetical protein